MSNISDQPIEYNLTRTANKNVNITVKNDGIIYVSAPKRLALADINKIVLAKKEWIIKAQRNIKSKKVIKDTPLIRNNSIVYLYGIPRKLLLVPCKKNFVALNENVIIFYIKEEYFNIQKYKSDFLNQSLKIELSKTINKYMNKYLKKLNLQISNMELRSMKIRWGTCIPSKKKILFNTKLVHCPVEAIEYVVLHEIAHLVKPNHSKSFYELIEKYMPDWKERKDLLQNYLIQ